VLCCGSVGRVEKKKKTETQKRKNKEKLRLDYFSIRFALIVSDVNRTKKEKNCENHNTMTSIRAPGV
jgi:hypothetical protein